MLNNLKVVFTVSVFQLTFTFANQIVSPLWSLSELMKVEQDGGSRSNLRKRAR